MTVNTLIIEPTGEAISFESVSIGADIDTFTFDVSISLASYLDYLKITPLIDEYTEISIKTHAQTFALIIEEGTRGGSISGGNKPTRSESYNARGRSKSALLDAPHSLPITKTWSNTTIRLIVQELCDAKGVTLNWALSDNININSYTANNILPINIIISLVGDKGIKALVNADFNGDLVVLERDKVSPASYANNVPDFIISDDDDLFVWNESSISRKKYDFIRIVAEDDALPNGLTNEPSITFESETVGNSVILKVFVATFETVDLLHSGLAFVNAVYEGVHTGSKTDDITILSGKGKTTRPFYGEISKEWLARDLGDLTVLEAGDITAAVLDHSIVSLTYTIKYHQYRVTPNSEIRKVLAYVEEE